MKKLLLLSSALITATLSFGQISLDLSDFGSVGDQVVVARDTAGVGINVGSPGANQSWDFTDLLIYTYSINTFGDPDTSDAAGVFPNAEILYTSSSNNTYFDTNNGEILLLGTNGDLGELISGQATGVELVVPFTDPQKVLDIPTNYLDQVTNDITTFEVKVAASDIGINVSFIDSIRVVHEGVASYEIDAWGEMTLLNDVEQVLRKKRVEYLVDSVFVKSSFSGNTWQLIDPAQSFGILDENPRLDTLTSYDFFAKGRDYSMVTVNTNTDGSIVDVLFLADSMLIANAIGLNAPCFGETGSAQASVLDLGTAPYSYEWSDALSQTTETATNLNVGTYTVTITGANGKMGIASAMVDEPTQLNVSNVVTDVTCVNGDNGAINVGVTGGTPGYSYLWSNGTTTEINENLSADTYSLTVTDANNCELVKPFTVNENAVAIVTTTDEVATAQCASCPTGYINLTTTGGDGSFTYAWSHGPVTEDVSDLLPDTYTVTITDGNNCESTEEFVVGAWAVGVNNINNEASFNFSPNPSTGIVFIKGSEQINIFNLLGDIVHSSNNLNKQEDSIDLSNLQNGVYFISNTVGEVTNASKLIIRK